MKAEAEKLFDQTMKELILIIEEFTPSELNESPFTGSWTAGQVADHLYKSYGVVQTLKGNVVPANRPVNEKILEIKELFLNFNIKMDSPEAILPSTHYIEKDDVLNGLQKRVFELRDLIAQEDLSLVCTDFAIPEYGAFTRLEWIYFTIYHTKRHLNQLEQIKEKVAA